MGNVSWVLELEIQQDQSADFDGLMQEMVASTEASEPGTLSYEWSTNGEGTVCHIFERYQDSSAVMAHLGAFGEKFADRFLKVFAPKRFVVYGSPNAEVKEALAGFQPTYMQSVGGFTR